MDAQAVGWQYRGRWAEVESMVRETEVNVLTRMFAARWFYRYKHPWVCFFCLC